MSVDNLFTPEVMGKVLNVLEKATEGSVTVLIVYFLVPLMLSLVSLALWITLCALVCKTAVKLCKGAVFYTSFLDINVNSYSSQSFKKQLLRLPASGSGCLEDNSVWVLKAALDEYEKNHGGLNA